MISELRRKNSGYSLTLSRSVRPSTHAAEKNCYSLAIAMSFATILSAMIPVAGANGLTGKQETPAVTAARARQEAVRTLEVKFKKTEWLAKASISDREPFPALKKRLKTTPEKDTTLESINRFVIDGEKLRYENNHPSWRMPGELYKSQILCFYNGSSTAKVFYPIGVGGSGQKEGIIERNARTPNSGVFELVPLPLTFRGLNPIFSSTQIDALKRSGVIHSIDGSQCHEYIRSSSGKGTTSSRYWLDPKMDYTVRRIQSHSKGRLVEQIDVSYREDETCRWVPTSWVYNCYSDDGAVLHFVTKIEVLEMRLNETQPAELFEMQFPPETIVSDNRNMKRYRVQADGTMREIVPQSKKPREATGIVYQPGDSWYRRNRWLLFSLVLALPLLCLAYVWRKKRGRASTLA